MPTTVSPRDLSGRITWIVVFVALAAACHVRWQITERLEVDLLPVSLMIVAYLGFRLTGWLGLIAGIGSFLPWTIVALATSDGPRGWDLVFEHVRLAPFRSRAYGVRGYALEFVVIAGAVGYFFGYLREKIDAILARQDLSIETLTQRRSPRSLLVRGYFLVEAMVAGRKERPASEHAGKGSRTSGLRGAVGFASALPVLVALNYQLVLLDGTVTILPDFVAATLVLVLAGISGNAARGARLAVAVWLGTNILMVALANGFDASSIGIKIGPGFLRASVSSPAQVIGLAILAWWAGTAGAVARDATLMEKFRRLGRSFARESAFAPSPSLLLFPAVLVTMVGANFVMGGGKIVMEWQPMWLLFVVLALYGRWRDALAVSNRAFVLLGVFTVFGSFQCADVVLSPAVRDLALVIVYALVPLAAGKLSFSSLGNTRILVYGFLVAVLLHDIYLAESRFTFPLDVSVQRIGGPRPVVQYHSIVLPLMLNVVCAELAARLLYWVRGTRTA